MHLTIEDASAHFYLAMSRLFAVQDHSALLLWKLDCSSPATASKYFPRNTQRKQVFFGKISQPGPLLQVAFTALNGLVFTVPDSSAVSKFNRLKDILSNYLSDIRG